jgi:hypothetical protein
MRLWQHALTSYRLSRPTNLAGLGLTGWDTFPPKSSDTEPELYFAILAAAELEFYDQLCESRPLGRPACRDGAGQESCIC